MEEIWKKVVNFENYEVSNLGNVRRVSCKIIYQNGQVCNYKEKILKLENNKGNLKGFYKRVTLCKNNKPKRFQVHRLVAEYFIPNPLNKPCVNHIDGNPSNNIASNLEWCTYKENEKHSYEILGKKNHNRILSKENVLSIRSNFKKGIGGNLLELSKLFNVKLNTIYSVVNNKTYKEWV